MELKNQSNYYNYNITAVFRCKWDNMIDSSWLGQL